MGFLFKPYSSSRRLIESARADEGKARLKLGSSEEVIWLEDKY